MVYDQLSLIEIVVCINTVSLPFASFVGAGHFLLDVLLKGLVKVLAKLLAVIVNFFGQCVESLEAISRPSTWQVACARTVD